MSSNWSLKLLLFYLLLGLTTIFAPSFFAFWISNSVQLPSTFRHSIDLILYYMLFHNFLSSPLLFDTLIKKTGIFRVAAMYWLELQVAISETDQKTPLNEIRAKLTWEFAFVPRVFNMMSCQVPVQISYDLY